MEYVLLYVWLSGGTCTTQRPHHKLVYTLDSSVSFVGTRRALKE
jgi:hypothetical protein